MKNKKILISSDDVRDYAEKKGVVIVDRPDRDPSKEIGDGSFDMVNQEEAVVKWDPKTLSWSNGVGASHLCAFLQAGEKANTTLNRG